MIGSHIVDILLKEYQCKVKVVDNLKVASHPEQKKPVWVPDEVEFIQGSAADRKLMESAMQGVDVVFHQAASGTEFSNPGTYTHCFTDATMTTCMIFDVIKDLKLPCKKVVVASSMAVYGEASYARKDGSEYIPDAYRPTERLEKSLFEVIDEKGEECTPFAMKESRALLPPFSYHIAKFNQEKIALSAGKEMGISVTALRYSIVHGPRQSVHNPYTGVMSIFCTQILNNRSPKVFEDGKQTRDFMFAEDVARANVFVAMHPKTGGEFYNVGSGRGGDKMGDVAGILCDLLRAPGSDVKPEFSGLFRATDTRHIRLDATKLMSLGWKPRYTLEQGLKKHTDWVKEVAAAAGGVEDKFQSVLDKMTETGVVKRRKVGE